MGRWAIDFAQFTLQLFNDIVLKNTGYVDLVSAISTRTAPITLAPCDAQNRVNFYDGQVSVVDPEGKRIGQYSAPQYMDWIAEQVEPWTY